jgi:TRAP-type C4-dicarboxylate transport system permease small subunit
MFKMLARLSDRLLAAVAVLLLLSMLTSVFLGVVFRLANRPLAWSDEMGQYLLVWTAFVGWIIAGNRGSHIRITVIVDRLRGGARAAAEIVIQLFVAVLGLVLLTQSNGLITRNLDVEWVSLPLSVALVYIPIPIAGFAVVLQSALAIVAVLRGETPGGPARSLT